MRRFCGWILTALLLPAAVGWAPRAHAQMGEEIYDKVVRSVAGVFVPILGPDGKPTGLTKIGAGVLIDAEKKLVLTSHAVVRDAKQVAVAFPVFDKAGQQLTDVNRYIEMVTRERVGIPGEVIANSRDQNLAVIRLARLPSGLQGVKLAAASPEQASTVWGFGHPLSGPLAKKSGQMFNITEGLVRSVGAQEVIAGDGNTELDFRVKARILSVTNPLNRGDEGGPLVNAKGEIVGIQNGPENIAKAQLVSLAVDIEEINKFLTEHKITAKGTLTVEEKAKGPAVDTEALYKQAVRAAVFITSSGSDGSFGMGSGSLIDLERRLVVTNYHVVGKEEYVHVQFPFFEKGEMVTDKKRYIERVPLGQAIKANVQYRDPTRDLAIIKLTKDPPPGTTALPLAEQSMRPGSTVWNIGSPGAVEQVFSTTRGIIRCSGLQEYALGGGKEVQHITAKVVTVTLATNPGDSGGPYINAKGELVAVHHAGQPRSNLMSSAIDLAELKAFLAEKGYDIKGVHTPGTGVTKKDPPKKTNPPITKENPSGTSNDEKAAESALRLAKTLANNEDARDRYKARLEEVFKKYPNTMAGKEAKRLWEALK